MENNVIHRIPIEPDGFNSPRARTIAKTPNGTIWIGSWGAGLFAFRDGKFTQYSTQDGYLGHDNVLDLQVDGDRLWVGTWGGGLTLIEDNRFYTYRNTSGDANTIQSDFIECFLLDKTRSLWIGTFGSGLTRLEKNHFDQLSYRIRNQDAPSPKFIRGTIEDQMGRIWVGGFLGIQVFDSGSLKSIHEVYPSFPKIAPVNSIFKSSKGHIWIGGSTNVGLYVFDGKRLIDKSFWPKVNFKDYFITAISETADGKIVISADVGGGLHLIQEDSISSFYHDPKNENSLSSSSIYLAKESSDSTLWIGTARHGLTSYKDGVFKRYTADPKNPHAISNNYVYDIVETSDGIIWVGTESGLNRFDPNTNQFQHFFESEGLLNPTIMSMVKDSEGNIWIGTQSGISKMDPSTFAIQNFDRNSGLKAHPFQRASTYLKKSTGEIFMGGVNEMVIFKPDSVIQLLEQPKTKITNLLINNVQVYPGENSILKLPIERTSKIEFKRLEGSIAFEYSNLKFGAGPESRYSYRLEGFEEEWHTVNKSQRAIYSNLPVGNYVFKVRSSANDAEWGPATTLLLQVAPHWWETLWFRGILVLILLSIAVSIIFIRFKLLKKKQLGLQKLVDSKTKDLQEANKQLMHLQEKRIIGQENERLAVSREVHDGISQTLFGIRLMVNQQKEKSNGETIEVPKEIDPLLNEVIQETRIILNNLGTSYLTHDTFKESLENLISKAERITNSMILLNWLGDDHVQDVLVGANMFRIIQESLTNAIKYAQANSIIVEVHNFDQIKCSVTDDGIGFSQNDQNDGHGLSNMHVRSREMNAHLSIDSKPGFGTIVTIRK